MAKIQFTELLDGRGLNIDFDITSLVEKSKNSALFFDGDNLVGIHIVGKNL